MVETVRAEGLDLDKLGRPHNGGRILVADDDAINRRLLQKFLSMWGYDVVLANDGSEAWNILQQADAPQLAILDWMMPGMDGLEICREARKRSDQSYTYILLLTASLQKTDIVTGLDAGADDYLTKPFDSKELRARLRTGRRIIDLQEQLRAAYDKVQFQASHDALTGMKNRAAILQTLETELARAKRQGTTIGILLVDLDHFKRVNDTCGHLAGDAVLRETAKRMRSSVRPYDSIGRYGGEEFLIVMPGCDIDSAMNRAECLRAAVAGKPIETPEAMIHVTLSIGVTVGGGNKESEAEWLLRAADTALYKAKHGGRNRVEMTMGDQERFAGSSPKSMTEEIMAGTI